MEMAENTKDERTCYTCKHSFRNNQSDKHTCITIVGRCIKYNKWEPVDENIEKPLIGEFKIQKGYEALAREMQSAIDQAAIGKGKERHATNEPFESQKICQITRWISGSPVAGVLFQAIKKQLNHRALLQRQQ